MKLLINKHKWRAYRNRWKQTNQHNGQACPVQVFRLHKRQLHKESKMRMAWETLAKGGTQ